jgi:uncharacterized protein
MSYERPLKKTILSELSRPTTVIHALIGPRQVGKTTIARQIEESISIPTVYATADSPVPLDSTWVETQWKRALMAQGPRHKPVLLILDEVQKVRGWGETIKLLWDNRSKAQKIRVLILGSSSLLMQEGLNESLAGRFFLHRCPHWGYTECRNAFKFSLEQWIYFGGYPGAVPFVKNETSWKRYIVDSLIETVLARDVLQMSRIAKPVLLRHLFALSATFPAQSLSYTKMLGQLQDAGNTTTLAHYLRLLESAFLVSGLELFSQGHKRKRGSSPKLVLWNNALVNALSTQDFTQSAADPVWWGRLVENAVGSHLCNGLHPAEHTITYWREGMHEVDYVVSAGRGVWALEVKSGRARSVGGLERFKSRYPRAKTLLVGGQGIPLREFFEADSNELFR